MARKSERRKGGTRSSSGGGGDSARGGKSVAKVKASAKPTPKPAPAPPTPKVKFHGKLLENEPLARYTTWRIGGAAGDLPPPPRTHGVGGALQLGQGRGRPWVVLGVRSHLVVQERGGFGVRIPRGQRP